MLIKLETIVKSKNSLDLLMGKKGFPFKISYNLSKMNRIIQKEFNLFEKVRNEKIMELGILTEDGNYNISKENLPKFQKDMQELLDVELDIYFEPIPIDILENCDMEPVVLSELHWLFIES